MAARKKSEVRIELMPLQKLRAWDRNPKRHDIPTLKQSLRRFGYVAPILVDEESKRIVAGHGRAEALSELKEEGSDPPSRIELNSRKEWLVPVLRGVRFGNRREAEAYLLADNRLAELGGWNDGLLAEMLGDLDDISGLGWDEADVEVLTHVPEFMPGNDSTRIDEKAEGAPTICPNCGHEF